MSVTRYSVDNYEEMIRLGVLGENDRVELIRGEIVPKMPIGSKHAGSVKRMNSLISSRAGNRSVVGVQDPVRLIDSEPEPDISVMRPRSDFYSTSHPQPPDILMIARVSDSSLDEDRNIKGPLYAEAGIPEYWIVNLIDECIEIHRGPQADGTYQDVRVLRRGEQAEIAALPGVSIAVDEVI